MDQRGKREGSKSSGGGAAGEHGEQPGLGWAIAGGGWGTLTWSGALHYALFDQFFFSIFVYTGVMD